MGSWENLCKIRAIGPARFSLCVNALPREGAVLAGAALRCALWPPRSFSLGAGGWRKNAERISRFESIAEHRD